MSGSPIQPSEADSPPPDHRVRFWKNVRLVSIWGMIGGPVIFFGGRVIAMMRAFEKLTQQGGADASELAGDISIAVYSSLVGILMLVACFPLFYWAGFRKRKAQRDLEDKFLDQR